MNSSGSAGFKGKLKIKVIRAQPWWRRVLNFFFGSKQK